MPAPTYVDDIRGRLAARLPGEDPALLDLCTLLALVRGADVTLADVHDAWALWRSRSNPTHPALVPFDQLKPAVQAMDEPYANAIRATAAKRAEQPAAQAGGTVDCRSPEGVTVGLVDAIITSARVLRGRDMTSPAVAEALADLADDEDVARLLASVGVEPLITNE